MSLKFVVAIVGRPNVGKSTFFNRCIGARHAIVDDQPGVTRDRLYKETDWCGHELMLVDTGGIVTAGKDHVATQVYDQVKLAMAEADAIVFLVDGKSGLSGADQEVANLLRRAKKPVVVAVNKIDEPKEEVNALEFYALGLGEPVALSALRGTGGVGDVLDRLVDALGAPRNGKKKTGKKKDFDWQEEQEIEQDEQAKLAGPISVAFVGKPNVGKSSIVNLLCGVNRTIVGAEPGTTRDAIDTHIKVHGKEYIVVDTAGIRRKNRVEYGIEAFAVVRSLKAIERADVVVFILDANEEITDQDQKIASKIEDAGKACVIVLNKWDLVEKKSSADMNVLVDTIKQQLRSLNFAAVLFTSAITRQRINKIIEAVDKSFEATCKRVQTSLLNQIVNQAVALTPPPAVKRGKRLKVYYTTQVSVAPPTFVVFANDNKLLTRSYEVYLERQIRAAFGYDGTPIRLIVRAKKEGGK